MPSSRSPLRRNRLNLSYLKRNFFPFTTLGYTRAQREKSLVSPLNSSNGIEFKNIKVHEIKDRFDIEPRDEIISPIEEHTDNDTGYEISVFQQEVVTKPRRHSEVVDTQSGTTQINANYLRVTQGAIANAITCRFLREFLQLFTDSENKV